MTADFHLLLTSDFGSTINEGMVADLDNSLVRIQVKPGMLVQDDVIADEELGSFGLRHRHASAYPQQLPALIDMPPKERTEQYAITEFEVILDASVAYVHCGVAAFLGLHSSRDVLE